MHWTLRQGYAAECARSVATRAGWGESKAEAIIAIGGDGTLREVAEGLVAAPKKWVPPLIVLPGGTGNSNYRSLWDDAPWETTLRAAITGDGAELRLLDLAQTDSNRLVMLGASTGISSAATESAASMNVAGRSRYLAALDSIIPSYKPYPGQVVVDGEVIHEGLTTLANVGGGRHRAGVFQILPHSIRDDGLLDVCVIGEEIGPQAALALMREAAHVGLPGVVYKQGRTVTVARTDGQPLLYETDGEVVPGDSSSFTISVMPNALPVLSSVSRPGG